MRSPGVRFVPKSSNSKLSPVVRGRKRGKHYEIIPIKPHASSTYVSITATCPDTCVFKGNGCFASSGVTGRLVETLDKEASAGAGRRVLSAEADAIAAAFWNGVPQDGGKYGTSGRDLRLHVSGDVTSTYTTRLLAKATKSWLARGGGAVWGYTHRWRRIKAEEWYPINILASCETTGDVLDASKRGYATSMVVRRFEEHRAYKIEGMGTLLPCPAETSKTTCVQCRLCLRTDYLRAKRFTIGFTPHGRDKAKAVKALPILNSLFGVIG